MAYVKVIIDYPKKEAVLKDVTVDTVTLDTLFTQLADGTYADQGFPANSVQAQHSKSYLVFVCSFGKDPVSVSPTEQGTATLGALGVANGTTICLYAPVLIKPGRSQLVAAQAAEEEAEEEDLDDEDGKFRGLSVQRVVAELAQPATETKRLEILKEFVEVNAEVILNSTHFLKAKKVVVLEMLKLDKLSVSEAILFKNLVKWGEKQKKSTDSKLSTVVTEDLLSLVRFPLMDVEDIAGIVAQSKLLSSQQQLDLFSFLLSDKKQPLGDSLSAFSQKPRAWRHKQLPWMVDGVASTQKYNFDHCRGYSFAVTKPTTLHGFGIRADVQKKKDLAIVITLYGGHKQQLASNPKALMTTKAKYTIDAKDPHLVLLQFKKPIALKKGLQYAVMVRLPSGTAFFYRSAGNGMRSVGPFQITSKYLYSNNNTVSANSYNLDFVALHT